VARTSPRVAGFLAALIMAIALQAIGAERVSRPLFDMWQRLAPLDLSQTHVRIVEIDEASLNQFGSWPWPRYRLAALTRAIGRHYPKVIGFDMLFPEGDPTNPTNFTLIYPSLSSSARNEITNLRTVDAMFSDAIGENIVVLARAGLDTATVSIPDVQPNEIFTNKLPKSVRRVTAATTNVFELDFAARGLGLIDGTADTDGIVRRLPLAGRVAGAQMPGFALELARIARGVERIAPESDGHNLRALHFDKTRLPAESDGRMRLRFGHFPQSAIISAKDLLLGKAPPSALADKIVIIGLAGAGTADIVTTPRSSAEYGTKIQANAVQAILDGQTLERPRWAWLVEGLITILLVALVVHFFPRGRPAVAGAGATLVLLTLLGASLAVFARAGLLLDPMGPLLTSGAAGLVMLALLFSETRRQRAQLALTLQEERVVAAKAAGEIAAARTIQMGMLPPRLGLAGFDQAVELDALIEPARSVGGDFYDAIRIDESHACFLVGDVTGKGVPAALFMALSKALTKSVLLRDGHDLGAAITRLNDEIARDNSEDMFVTMVFGLLDTRSGLLSLCSAGHENPWAVRANGEINRLNPEGGPPLSVVPGFVYEAETVQLERGDTIIFVSDGITEAQNGAGGFFGSERLAETLRRTMSAADVATTSDALLEDVRLFEDGAVASDDLTVLLFRYKGQPN
jgi:adenylate cyclase